MSKALREFQCEVYGGKKGEWPAFGCRVAAHSVADAKLAASNDAREHGWPPVRKVVVKEIK